MKHELYTINVSFIVCDGMSDKVLDEIRELTQHVEKNSLGHAANLKVRVSHVPASEVDAL